MNVLLRVAAGRPARQTLGRSGGPVRRCGAGTCRCRGCGPPPIPPVRHGDVSRPGRAACRPSGRTSGCGRLLAHHDRAERAAEAARQAWEAAIFDADATRPIPACSTSAAAAPPPCITMTRGYFYAAAVSRAAPPLARWQIDPPRRSLRDRSVGALRDGRSIRNRSRSRAASCARACANTGCARPRRRARLAHGRGSETAVCARRRAGRRRGIGDTLISGSGLCLEFDLLTAPHDPGPAAGRAGLAGDRADLALSRPARHAGLLWRRAVLCPGADRHARPDRGPGRRDGAADRLGARPVRRHGRGRRHLHDLLRGPAGREPLRSLAGRARGPTRVHADQPFRPPRGGHL